jgi:hypothetical protein
LSYFETHRCSVQPSALILLERKLNLLERKITKDDGWQELNPSLADARYPIYEAARPTLNHGSLFPHVLSMNWYYQ